MNNEMVEIKFNLVGQELTGSIRGEASLQTHVTVVCEAVQYLVKHIAEETGTSAEASAVGILTSVLLNLNPDLAETTKLNDLMDEVTKVELSDEDMAEIEQFIKKHRA